MSDNAVDIVISTYRPGGRLHRTIESILQSSYQNFTLWVLDQNEHDQMECGIAGLAADPRIRYLRVPLSGIAATRNRGAAMGSAPYILFTNDDCTVDPEWIGSLVAELFASDCWAAFGRVLAGPQPKATVEALALKPSRERRVYHHQRFNLGFGHGHNMGVRRQRFEELGGFDELLGGARLPGSGRPLGAWEDRDLGYRVLRRGGTIVYTPHAVVYHHHWQNWKGARRSYRSYGIGSGAAVAKYLRCGDPAAIWILFEWQFSQGLRQILSGLFKWHSLGKVSVGLTQLIYPWVGLARGLRYPCDRQRILYRRPPTLTSATGNGMHHA